MQYAHRLFHKPNQKFDRNSVDWIHSEIKLSAGVTLPAHVGSYLQKKILGSGQARPVEVLSNFWFGL